MAFKMVEGFAALQAAVQAFAGRGAKAADQFGMKRIAARARHGFFGKEFGFAELLRWVGGRNAVGF